MMPATPLWRTARSSAAAVCAWLAMLLGGCAQPPQAGPATPAAAGGQAPSASAGAGALYSMFHRPLQTPPQGSVEVMRLQGEGAQIFRCESQPAGLRWIYRLPDAELRDAKGNVIVHHGVNLSFEHVDGSRLVGEIVDHVPSPNSDSLPWLLLKTHVFGDGALAAITYVQRINTVGGMPPSRCEAEQLNQVLRVPFSAEFVFYR